MNPRTLSASIGIAVMVWAGASLAQSGPAVFKLPVIEITGRVQKPIATIDIARAQPTLTLTALRRPFTDRIEQAVAREPY